jgi:hypothetical protein
MLSISKVSDQPQRGCISEPRVDLKKSGLLLGRMQGFSLNSKVGIILVRLMYVRLTARSEYPCAPSKEVRTSLS